MIPQTNPGGSVDSPVTAEFSISGRGPVVGPPRVPRGILTARLQPAPTHHPCGIRDQFYVATSNPAQPAISSTASRPPRSLRLRSRLRPVGSSSDCSRTPATATAPRRRQGCVSSCLFDRRGADARHADAEQPIAGARLAVVSIRWRPSPRNTCCHANTGRPRSPAVPLAVSVRRGSPRRLAMSGSPARQGAPHFTPHVKPGCFAARNREGCHAAVGYDAVVLPRERARSPLAPVVGISASVQRYPPCPQLVQLVSFTM